MMFNKIKLKNAVLSPLINIVKKYNKKINKLKILFIFKKKIEIKKIGYNFSKKLPNIS